MSALLTPKATDPNIPEKTTTTLSPFLIYIRNTLIVLYSLCASTPR